ncbi:hypothetical protein L3Q72_06735 [Vibrio sp. JC009]|uniref:hypothetical protein n=1 Tax=Vibrio sp. JC009 TaxID=2912314 RepID=UPI0023AF118B|nr:hypothetical protein [Vibrio sp. JC009]WED23084.1 hypothetical protein L3Q72_06735 [Vibrio sp. JC009]
MDILVSDNSNINSKEHSSLMDAIESAQMVLNSIESALCLVLEQLESGTFAYGTIEGAIILADYERKNLKDSTQPK